MRGEKKIRTRKYWKEESRRGGRKNKGKANRIDGLRRGGWEVEKENNGRGVRCRVRRDCYKNR